jgi:hypothetical protein
MNNTDPTINGWIQAPAKHNIDNFELAINTHDVHEMHNICI